MRNQTWDMSGTLVLDRELFVDFGTLKVHDYLSGEIGPPTLEEIRIWGTQQIPPRDLASEIDALTARIKTLEAKAII